MTLPQPGVEQSRQHAARAAVLHHGLQGQVDLLLNKCAGRGLSDPQQQSTAGSLHLYVHVLLQVGVETAQGVYGCTGHSRTQVLYLRGQNEHEQ